MRGEAEQKCLEQIQNDIKGVCGNGQSLECVYSDCPVEVLKLICCAEPNPQSSKFPDFLFPGGFIEHFEVTTTKESKKGAVLKREENKFQKEVQNQFEAFREEIAGITEPHTIVSRVVEKEFLGSTYDDFVSSFERSWKHHIGSLDNYRGEKDIGIFLIENTGSAFKQMRNEQYLRALHRLSVDRRLLSIVEEDKEKLSYVVYKQAQFYEIIKVETIPMLMKQIPEWLYFEPGRKIASNIHMGIVL